MEAVIWALGGWCLQVLWDLWGCNRHCDHSWCTEGLRNKPPHGLQNTRSLQTFALEWNHQIAFEVVKSNLGAQCDCSLIGFSTCIVVKKVLASEAPSCWYVWDGWFIGFLRRAYIIFSTQCILITEYPSLEYWNYGSDLTNVSEIELWGLITFAFNIHVIPKVHLSLAKI